MNRLRVPTAAVLFASAVLAAGGCASSGNRPRHIVADSGLNWVEITYLPGTGQPPVQIALFGVGHMRLKRGRSPLVTDSFSIDVAHAAWTDIAADQLNVPREEARAIFQALADRGVLAPPDREFLAAVPAGGPVAHVRGRIDTETVNRQAAEPELLAYIRELAGYFDRASPHGGAGKGNEP